MTTEIIDPNYQWKQAASQEGVDYGAVQKSFMDQSYAIVANKAKILFQDPFRLGFEIVHRNEKATKMVGIFAFRVNSNLLYAPVFFVNGEIKAADMLYRTDVKRFVPLTEDWCAYLVRGNHESAGEPVDRNRYRQADAYMDRLAYPQRVKYASEEKFKAEAIVADIFGALEDLRKTANGMPSFGRSVGVGLMGAVPAALLGALAGGGVELLDENTHHLSPAALKAVQKLLTYGREREVVYSRSIWMVNSILPCGKTARRKRRSRTITNRSCVKLLPR